MCIYDIFLLFFIFVFTNLKLLMDIGNNLYFCDILYIWNNIFLIFIIFVLGL